MDSARALSPVPSLGWAALLAAVVLAGCHGPKASPVPVPNADERAAFDREVEVRILRPDRQTPASFVARIGVKTRAADFFIRHAAIFGLRAGMDSLEPGAARPDAFGSASRVHFFQQHFRGVPVSSHGYRVYENADGNVLSAIGSVLRGINRTVAPALTAEQAVVQMYAKAGVPSEKRSARGIVSKLILTPGGDGENAANIRLVWRIHRQGEYEGLFSELDAATGALLFAQPRVIH